MKRRRAVSTQIDCPRHRVAAGSITLSTHWSPEQAVAVFEILHELREHVWARYGLQIQQVLRDERDTAAHASDHIDIDIDDVPV